MNRINMYVRYFGCGQKKQELKLKLKSLSLKTSNYFHGVFIY